MQFLHETGRMPDFAVADSDGFAPVSNNV